MDDDFLTDYYFLKSSELEEENENLRQENENLQNQLDEIRYSGSRRTNFIDEDRARTFAEDVQSVASDCGIYLEISYDEAEQAIQDGYTPEEYYEFKINA